jgi:hypothetical protein
LGEGAADETREETALVQTLLDDLTGVAVERKKLGDDDVVEKRVDRKEVCGQKEFEAAVWASALSETPRKRMARVEDSGRRGRRAVGLYVEYEKKAVEGVRLAGKVGEEDRRLSGTSFGGRKKMMRRRMRNARLEEGEDIVGPLEKARC